MFACGILSLFCLIPFSRLSRMCILFWKLICTGNTPIKQSKNDSNDGYDNQLLFDWYIDKYLVMNLLYGLSDYFLVLINIIISLIAWQRFYGLFNAITHCSSDITNHHKEYPSFPYKLLFRNFIIAIIEAIGLILVSFPKI